MAYFKNPASKTYESDIKDRVAGRVHLSLKTKTEREAKRRDAALEALVRAAGEPSAKEVLRLLRARKGNIAAVTACYEAGRPWDALLAARHWPTLTDAVDDYLAWLAAHPDRAASTHAMAKTRLDAAVAALGADTPVDEVTGQSVDDWRQALTAGGLADATVAAYLIRLSTLYGWLERREQRRAFEAKRAPRALPSPVDAELVPTGRGRRERFLSGDEARRLVAATPPALRAAVLLGILAGLRIGEVQHLRPEDVDLELGLLYVQPKPAPWRKGGVWKPKTKHSVREVPVEPQLATALRAHLGAAAGPLWLFPAADRADRPVSRTYLTGAATRLVRDAGLALTEAERAAGREPVTFHTLRHTFASWLVMEGENLFTVARLLGHADTTEVEGTYGHLSPEHRAQAIARLGRRFTLATVETDEAIGEPAGAPAGAPDAAPSQLETQEAGV